MKEALYVPAGLDTTPVTWIEIPVMVVFIYILFSTLEMLSNLEPSKYQYIVLFPSNLFYSVLFFFF